jgi:SOS-response transcriptional repressor LexA
MIDHPSSRRGRDQRDSDRSEHGRDIDAEREADRLVRLLGERALAELDSGSDVSARFHDWWARELRAGTARAELDAGAIAFERRMREQIVSKETHVVIAERRPSFRPPVVEGTVSSMVALARSVACAPVLDLGAAAGVGRELWDEPCTSWLELPEDVPPGQHVALTVRGDSMEPLLHAGDTILLKLDPELRRGAVVVARRPDDGYVVKRVSRVGPKVVELASLNPRYPPIRIPRRDDLVLGTVLMCWRQHPPA